ncbi:anthranilate synthase component I [Enterococcus hirae]|nr:anthranilate synthase component I [Enterococcus hirae]
MRKIKTFQSDQLTPAAAFLRIQGKNKCILESIPREKDKSRYSMIFWDPAEHLSFQDGFFRTTTAEYRCSDPLKEVERFVLKEELPIADLPFSGGAVGYVAYDLARCYENIGELPPDEQGIPELSLFLFDSFLIIDHQTETGYLVEQDLYRPRSDAELAAALQKTERSLQQVSPAEFSFPEFEVGEYHSNFTQKQFEETVEKAKQLITDGDLFQLVPSQRLQADFAGDAFSYYRRLRIQNPSPYLYYLDMGDAVVIGASPESLVSVRGDKVMTNPIAGTRRRGQNAVEDERLAGELLQDEKERAEHMMLVDLGRNDLGRVAEVGTVEVTLFMTIERYRYVMHLVSVVEGRLKQNATMMDALKSTMPAGTVSGAPKIRAMQRINQLEPVRRNLYAGAVGYFSQTGDGDFAIAIRTMVIKDQTAYVQAGAGIVYDSVAENEYHETLQKAKALLEVGK